MAEAQDCPYCGLVNPPDALQCDCGYHFAAHRVGRSNLSEEDLARQADSCLPVYVPGGCLSALMLLVITGTNGTGMCLALIAALVSSLVGVLAGRGPWVYLVAFGVTAIVVDALVRRYVLRCSPVEVKRASQFMGFPVWMFGIGVLVAGIMVMLES